MNNSREKHGDYRYPTHAEETPPARWLDVAANQRDVNSLLDRCRAAQVDACHDSNGRQTHDDHADVNDVGSRGAAQARERRGADDYHRTDHDGQFTVDAEYGGDDDAHQQWLKDIDNQVFGLHAKTG